MGQISVVQLAAGAAGMYCGSCMHDNRLAATLIEQGRNVVLLPLYTPLRTDETDVSRDRVYFGGINCYLQQTIGVFRHTPWALDRLFDARVLLNAVGRFASSTQPEALGAMTVSMLKGTEGLQRKELDKLLATLREFKPDVIHLPNLMFVGVGRALRDALGVPVVANLAGEDIFLDRFPEPYRSEVFGLIREQSADIDAFVALSQYYAEHATAHFGLPADRVRCVPLGIRTADFGPPATAPAGVFTIGFLAHVFAEKGLDRLAEAFIRLRRDGRACRLRAAGYLGPADKAYLDDVHEQVRGAGFAEDFEYVGELDRDGKRRFLQTLHVFSVPTAFPESKGFFVLEAMAAGVPVVQPAHGAFPELIESTGGGLPVAPDDPQALAYGLGRLMDDDALRRELGEAGRAAVLARHDAEHVAAAVWELYEALVG